MSVLMTANKRLQLVTVDMQLRYSAPIYTIGLVAIRLVLLEMVLSQDLASERTPIGLYSYPASHLLLLLRP